MASDAIGAILVLLFFGSLLLGIYYGTKVSQHSKLAKFIKKLRENNFTIKDKESTNEIMNFEQKGFFRLLFSSIPSFKASKGSTKFSFDQDSVGYGEYSEAVLRIECEMPINENFYLKISKRGFFSQLLGINKGDYFGLNEDYNIKCNNLRIAKLLINNKRNLQLIKNLLDKDREALIIKNCEAQRKVKYTDANDLFPKTNSLYKLSSEISKISKKYGIDSETELTFEIDDDEDLKVLTYSELEFLSPTCVICYQNLIDDISQINASRIHHVQLDQVLYLLCCSTFVHEDHLFEWINQKNVCPYCKFKAPETDLVHVKVDIEVQ